VLLADPSFDELLQRNATRRRADGTGRLPDVLVLLCLGVDDHDPVKERLSMRYGTFGIFGMMHVYSLSYTPHFIIASFIRDRNNMTTGAYPT
jgi:hypothetical protein